MSTAYFPIISRDFFSPFFSLPSSPHDFFQMWAILYLCADWKQILLPGVHFNGSMLHLSHQNLNCIIFNFLLARDQSFFLRAMFIRVVEELVLQN